ncbi:MAG: precorrin-8X methylmutase [Lachnospiraceae bacterium]|nr:precorrin-8X methylmutase [Lachnospiraceae bacterium]
MLEYVLPGEIEKRSFEIIGEELTARGITLPTEEAPVTMRVIHTSADFEYATTMCYSVHAVERAKALLAGGADIVTDTNMALAGINKKALEKHGGHAFCFMADESVAAEAKERGLTRAAVSMEKAAKLAHKNGRKLIFAIGNAPTALIRLHEMMQVQCEGDGLHEAGRHFSPDFIIGVPVGFVNVEAAKELILESDVPYIVNRGRKGGSNVAAAICNALLYELGRD